MIELRGGQTSLFNTSPPFLKKTEWLIQIQPFEIVYDHFKFEKPEIERDRADLTVGWYLHEHDRFEVQVGLISDKIDALRTSLLQAAAVPDVSFELALSASMQDDFEGGSPGWPSLDELEAGQWILFDEDVCVEVVLNQ